MGRFKKGWNLKNHRCLGARFDRSSNKAAPQEAKTHYTTFPGKFNPLLLRVHGAAVRVNRFQRRPSLTFTFDPFGRFFGVIAGVAPAIHPGMGPGVKPAG
jgi:hypothetical protein